MLDSTLELITLVSSNSHLVFCFCNLLIGILFVSNSKSVFAPPRQDSSVTASTTRIESSKQQEDDAGDTSEILPQQVKMVSAVSCAEEVSVSNEEVFKHDEDDKIDEEDEDELRRRAEEFIEKINRTWKAEQLGTFSPYVQRQELHGHSDGTLVM